MTLSGYVHSKSIVGMKKIIKHNLLTKMYFSKFVNYLNTIVEFLTEVSISQYGFKCKTVLADTLWKTCWCHLAQTKAGFK